MSAKKQQTVEPWSEPLDCPWCGGFTYVAPDMKDDKPDGVFSVLCGDNKCLACGPSAPTPQEAVDRWNDVVSK